MRNPPKLLVAGVHHKREGLKKMIPNRNCTESELGIEKYVRYAAV